MATNIITAAYSSSNITYTKPAYQYDYGMILQFSGIELPQAYEVHFSNTEFCGESISQIGDETGVTIPDEMFLSGAPIYAWTYLHTGEDDGETVYKAVISVNKRAKPSDLEPTPVQQDAITQAIAALNVAVEQTAHDVISAGESAQAASDAADVAVEARDQTIDAKEAAEDAQEAAETAQGKAEDAQEAAEQAAGAVLGLTADASVDANTGTPSVEVNVSTVSDHKNMSFSFHNLKGVPGEPGDDGFSPVVSVSSITGGHEVSVTDKNGTQTFDVMDGTDGQDGISPTITVTEITGGHEVAVTDAQGTQTFDVMDGEVSEQDLEDALIDKADVITSSASGEIVTIADGAKNLPVVDLKVSLLPVQDLHGQDAPYPPGGGKNKADYPGMITAGAVEQTDGSLYVATAPSFYNKVIFQNDGTAGQFSLTFIVKNDDTLRGLYPVIVYTDSTSEAMSVYRGYESFTTFTKVSNSSKTVDKIIFDYGNNTVKTWFYVQVESGSIPTAWSPYSNVCSISGWTGVDVYHSDEDTTNPETTSIDWSSSAGTVYGGSLDLTSGVLTVDSQEVSLPSAQSQWYGGYGGVYIIRSDFYVLSANRSKVKCNALPIKSSHNSSDLGVYINGSEFYFEGLSNIGKDSFADRVEWVSSNVQLIAPLKNAIEYQLSPTQLATFLGVNNFWSNGNGTIDLEYRCDTKLYIEQLTKPSEDDMTANANITSGSFFMVGNRLFLSTVAIAQGATIIPGTNCTEISLADALNSLNS